MSGAKTAARIGVVQPTPLLAVVGVDFSDKPAGELHHRRSATNDAVGLN